MLSRPIPTTTRELVALSVILCPIPRAGKGHDAHHDPIERGFR